ncbi:serpin family protein [Endozoicomonas sp. 4G]|uniref:serpin family protein n=1 Tax=Endozoicomonas sp. 4G TaxID=2872754 RepID=UPI002078852F|nr:serpin family protein [Endozoicomonas sp. 4G]
MFLLSKSYHSACHHRPVLTLVSLLFFLLLPSELLAARCPKCGKNYADSFYYYQYKPCPLCRIEADDSLDDSSDDDSLDASLDGYAADSSGESSDFSSGDSTDSSDDASDEDLQNTARPSQASATANPDSSAGAQVDESQGTLALAVNIFSQAARRIPKNFLMSPDGLFQTLALLLMGADGATKALLESCLGEDYSEPDGAKASDATVSGATACAQDEYCIANCLLASRQVELQETYKDLFKQANDNIRDNINFANQASLQILAADLNRRFCELTHGMVKKFCNARDWQPNTIIALINSVYFKGLWERAFEARAGGGVFTLSDGEIVHIDRYMKGKIKSSQYAHYNHWQAVTVPYQGDHEMVLVLPPEGTMPHEVSPEIITALFSLLAPRELDSSDTISLGLPPFKVYSATDLANILSTSNLPLNALFTTPLSLGSMLTDPVPVDINILNQHCAMEVDEKGTQAAAVTQISCSRSMERAGRSIQFTRPFVYILRNTKTGRITFIGQILDPRNLGAGTSGS